MFWKLAFPRLRTIRLRGPVRPIVEDARERGTVVLPTSPKTWSYGGTISKLEVSSPVLEIRYGGQQGIVELRQSRATKVEGS